MTEKTTDLTYIIVLNWNGWSDTIECLESVLYSKHTNLRVIVCDNASSDNSMQHLLEWSSNKKLVFETVTQNKVDSNYQPSESTKLLFINNSGNLGFAGGNNVGVRQAMKNPGCKYIWLLNNDTTLEFDALGYAIERMEQDSRIGICGSTLIYFHDRNKVQAFGGANYSRWSGSAKHLGAFQSPSNIPLSPTEIERQMSYVIGAAMLVRRDFIERIGLMREDYFLYFEEIDWATRGLAHYKLGYAPKSIVYHKEGASIGTSSSGGSGLSVYYLFRNRLLFTWRFHRCFTPTVFVASLIDIVKHLYRKRWHQAVFALRGMFRLSAPIPKNKRD